MKKSVVIAVVVVLGGLLLWLVAAPTPVEPLAWNAPTAPASQANRALAGLERFASDVGKGPEAVAPGPNGELYAGMVDGRVVRVLPSGTVEIVANTGGRPLGIKRTSDGTLWVCDAMKGLLSISTAGVITVLASGHDGKPFLFADDLDVDTDGTVYFSDASQRFGVNDFRLDALEHGTTGRLLAYDPTTKQTRVLMDGLAFANGVALNGDHSFVAVNETYSYRIHRYWLRGPKAGTHDILVDNLPGFPDNLTFSPSGGVFWVALYAPRNPLLDAAASQPGLRKAISRLPESVQPAAKHVSWVLGVTEDGAVKHDLQDPDGAYAPITSVVEDHGFLIFGSLSATGLARIRFP